GAGHQPCLDVVRVLLGQARRSDAACRAANPVRRDGSVLRCVQPRLHRGLRPVTPDEAMAANDFSPAARPGLMPMTASPTAVPTMAEVIPAMTSTAARAPEEELAGGRPPSASRWLTAVVRTTRPRQWPKNLLVFAAPLAGATVGRPYGLAFAAAAAVAFGCASA